MSPHPTPPYRQQNMHYRTPTPTVWSTPVPHARRAASTLLLLGALALPGLVAHANTTPVSTPSAQVASVLQGAAWAGSARMRFLGFGVYDAQLWVAPGFKGTAYAQHPLVLELTYLRAFSGRSIARRSVEEMRRAAPIAPEQEQRWLAAMQAAFPDVKTGDQLTGLHTPGVGARFWLNGQALPPVNDPEFSRLFFGIWLAPTTSEPQLRAALLAGTSP